MTADFNKSLPTQDSNDTLNQIRLNRVALAKMDFYGNTSALLGSVAHHTNKFQILGPITQNQNQIVASFEERIKKPEDFLLSTQG